MPTCCFTLIKIMTKVLIIDDSAVIRRILSTELSRFDDIEVVGTAIDPYMAREKIVKLRPDVLTLDIEMPRMDGLTFLEKLMNSFPLPVVVVSSLAPENSDNAVRALSLGAIDIVSKPDSQFSAPDVAGHLVTAIRGAAKARMPKPNQFSSHKNNLQYTPPIETTHKIIAVGASTGGTRAIEQVLTDFPATAPGTVIVQHMPPGFTNSFAKRLDQMCKIKVAEARSGDLVVPGVALLAPGGKHMLLRNSGANYCVVLKDGPPICFQKPSVDVLFQSVARHAGKNAVGVILTGMGSDGGQGLLEMHKSGAQTIAQDEQTSVVFGMPGEAVRLGAAQNVLPLENIASQVMRLVSC